MINYIEIETCNVCNRACSWCLYSTVEEYKNRKLEYLDTNYIIKVMEELKEHDFSGIVSLFSINEPLLDERIRDGTLMRLCRNILTDKIKINIVTNGDFLTDEVLYTMIESGLDIINISCYDDEIFGKANMLYKIYSDKIKFTIYDFRKTNYFNNRAGKVPFGEKNNHTYSFCLYPAFNAYIGWDGEIRLCCNEATRQIRFGNIKNQNLYDILNSKKMRECKRIIVNDRNKFPICSKCNCTGIRLPMDTTID